MREEIHICSQGSSPRFRRINLDPQALPSLWHGQQLLLGKLILDLPLFWSLAFQPPDLCKKIIGLFLFGLFSYKLDWFVYSLVSDILLYQNRNIWTSDVFCIHFLVIFKAYIDSPECLCLAVMQGDVNKLNGVEDRNAYSSTVLSLSNS